MENPIAPTPADVAQKAQIAIDSIAESMNHLQSRYNTNSYYFYTSEDFRIINQTLDLALDAQKQLNCISELYSGEEISSMDDLKRAFSIQAELAFILTLFLREIKEHY